MIRFFENSQKGLNAYHKFLEPVCKNWRCTRKELDILVFLAEHPTNDRAADIVSSLGFAKSHVSICVAALERRGLICKLPEPGDMRAVRLSLTEAAAPIIEEARLAQAAFMDKASRGVDKKDLAVWQSVMQKLQLNLNAVKDV